MKLDDLGCILLIFFSFANILRRGSSLGLVYFKGQKSDWSEKHADHITITSGESACIDV